jgi:CRISPR-associated protein Csm5
MNDSETVKLELEVLTGIHIGSGDEIDPLSYLIIPREASDTGEPLMLRFRVETLVKHLNETGRKKLVELIDSGDPIKVRKQFAKMVQSLYGERPIVDYSSAVTSSVSRTFHENVDSLRNQLIVRTIFRSGIDHAPVVPGSSLKGALRTAVLQELGKANPQIIRSAYQEPNERYRKLDESRLLQYRGPAQSDPFRSLMIADSKVQGKRSTIVCSGTLWRPGKENTSPDLTMEVLRGRLLDGDATATIAVTMNNMAFNAGRKTTSGNDSFNPPEILLNLESVFSASNRFYRELFNRELKEFYLSTFDPAYRDAAMELSDIIDKMDENNEILIRVGRHSHKEFMTVHDQPLRFGRSRTLIEYGNRCVPAGWAVLRMIKTENSSVLRKSASDRKPRVIIKKRRDQE